MILLVVIGIAALECAFIANGHWTTQYQYVPSRIWVVIPLCWLAVAAVAALPAYILSRTWGPVITSVLLGCVLTGARASEARPSYAIGAGLVALLGIVLARPLGRWWLARPRAGAMFVAILVLLICAIGAAVTARPSRQSPAMSAASERPNVIVIFLDTLRYDAVFTPGGEVKRELPALRHLAGESIVFDAAYAPAPWTLPSHLSAVTGLSYEKLGVDFTHQQYRRSTLTLAERFRRDGYRTAAVIANSFLNTGTGFTRGFDSYEYATGALDVCRTAPGRLLDRNWPFFAASVCNWSAGHVTRRALRQMDDKSAQPYLLVLNYMDAHSPYYVEPGCGGGTPSYALAARCIDRHLAAIFDRSAQSRRKTIIVLTSDHGEHFGEHGLSSHGNSLYRELLHIPLMIRTAARTHRRVPEPVTLTDLPSLLMSAPAERQPVSASGVLDDPRAVTVFREHWQLIVHGDGREEVIDLKQRAAGPPPPLDLMRRDAQLIIRSMKPPSGPHFRSLGYEQ